MRERIPAPHSVHLKANEVARLDSPGAFWRVESGRLGIAVVPLEDGSPARARRFLFHVDRGDVVLWNPTAGARFGLVAVAEEDAEVAAFGKDDAPEIVADADAGKWFSRLAATLQGVENMTGEVPTGKSWPDALEGFEERFLAALASKELEEEDDRRRRIEKRQRLDAAITRSTLGELTTLGNRTGPPALPESVDPLLAALRLVGEAQGIAIREAPPDEHGRDRVQILAEASGVRTRHVVLEGEWWTRDQGPLLGFLGGNDHPVALIPGRSRSSSLRYEIVDGDARRRVSAAVAADLSEFAYVLTAPLPDSSSAMGVLRLALSGFSRDARVVAGCGVAAAALGMLLPLAIAVVVDYAITTANRSILFDVALGLGAAALGALLFEFAQAASLLRIETGGAAAVQAGVWDRLLRLRPDFFRQFTTGDLHSRVSAVSAIRQRLGGVTLATLFSAVVSLLNAIVMFYFSPVLGLVALGLAAIVSSGILLSGAQAARRMPKLQELEGRLVGLMVQIIDAVPKLRVAGAEQRAFARWAQTYSRKQRLNIEVFKLQDRIRLLSALLPAFAPALVYWAATRLAGPGGEGLTLGAFVAFNTALGTFLMGISTFSETGAGLLNISSLWKRTRTILDAEPETQSRGSSPIRLKGHVQLENVSFRYQADEPMILDRIDFEAEPGQSIALVGPSGGGKSTIVNLLLGFEKPSSGAVFYDGHDLKGLDVTSVRRQIGIVMQDNKIMAGSIFDNIASGSLSTISAAWDAAKAAGLADDIESMPMGMHTIISEGGTNLSGGQRQRLLIAHALVLKPRILILDEATSALDNRTQGIVMKNLDSLDVTRILVAHRLSTIRHADRIYVIDGGRVVQSGTFAALSAEDGLFARLMARQKA